MFHLIADYDSVDRGLRRPAINCELITLSDYNNLISSLTPSNNPILSSLIQSILSNR